MIPEEKLKTLINQSQVRTSSQTDERIIADAVDRMAKLTPQSPSQTGPNLWRIIMKSPISKLAVAAIVFIACLIGLSLWRNSGSGIALADVLAQIEKVKAFRCQFSSDGTVEGPNEPESYKRRGIHFISQEYGEKINYEVLDPNGTKSTFEFYGLPDKRTRINISRDQKKYWRTEFDDRAAEEWSKFDPRTQTKRILEFKHESLGRSTIDGIEVEGFQTTDPNYVGRGLKNPQVDVRIWVDAKTRLPVRYESLMSDYFNRKGDKIVWREHSVMYDFQWDVPVDASEFKPVIPDDYKGVVIQFPEHITEETAIQGLKLIAELLGNYPRKITNVYDDTVLRLAKKSETPAALRLREEIEGLTDEEALNKLVDFLMPIRGLFMFPARQKDKKDFKYYGNTVIPKDTDNILMRWKVSDNEYRVIYGDLRTETVTPEKLAELEAVWPNEETAIQGLKLWGKLLNNYPGKITNVDGMVLPLAKKSEAPTALRLREQIQGLTNEEALNKLMDFLMPLCGLERFYERQNDPAYYGKTVVPKDADNILMRWKVSDNEYRIIYGDLRTETVTTKRLAELEAALPNEETAIQGLKLLVELLGKYPDPNMNIADSVVIWSGIKKMVINSETPAALQLKEELKGLTEEEINNKLEVFLMPIRGLIGFCIGLERDKKDLEYVLWKYGKPLTIKDADKVLLRWKVSDSEYRVIYGDLHAETITTKKLAELEAALPK